MLYGIEPEKVSAKVCKTAQICKKTATELAYFYQTINVLLLERNRRIKNGKSFFLKQNELTLQKFIFPNLTMQLKYSTLLCIFCLFLSKAHAQIGINTDNSTPHSSAMLDVKSTDKGVLSFMVSFYL
jgi:hypothetical protein